MLPSALLTPNHWANQNLVAWWSTLPGLAWGPKWYDLTGQYDWTLNVKSGSGGVANWSRVIRPGSLGSGSFGPTSTGGTNWYGSSSLSLPTKCTSAGTIALWLCPTVAAASENAYWLNQSFTGSYNPDFFGFGQFAGTYYAGYTFNSSTNRRVVQACGSEWAIGRWLHLTLTWAAGDFCRLYANGALIGTAANACATPLPSINNTLVLGMDWPGQTYFTTCSIDDVSIWSDQKSAARVAQLYNESVTGWTGRLNVESPYRVFPDLEWLANIPDNGVRVASGGMAQGGTATVDSSARTASGGMAQGGASDSRYVPYVATWPRVEVTLDPRHWANRNLSGWWTALPNLTSGSTWLDLTNRHPWVATCTGGTDSRSNTIWSPSTGAAAGPLGSVGARPGAYTQSFIGPLQYGSGPTQWYANASPAADISALCPNGTGSLAFWLIGATAYNANTKQAVLGQNLTGTQFCVLTDGGKLYGGFYQSPTEYRAVLTLSASNWSTTSWHHYMLVWGVGFPAKWYVDGQLAATSGTNGAVVAPAGSLTFSTNYNNAGAYFYLQSGVDDLAIWSRAFSAAEVWNVYQQSMAGWPGRADISNPNRVFEPPFDLTLYAGPWSYSHSGVGGMPQGGYPERTSSWIMPGIGGMTDGGKRTGPVMAYGPSPVGGMSDGGDTANPLAWDTFAGSNGTLLTAHKSDDGGTWTKHPSYSSSAATLDGSGQVYGNLFRGVFLHSYAQPSADYVVSCDCHEVNNRGFEAGVGARWDSSANTGYYAYVNLDTIYIKKVVSGSATQLGSASISWSVGNTRRLSLLVLGTTIEVYWDSQLKLGPYTDSSVSATGSAALYVYGDDIKVDNWMSTGGGVQARYALSGDGGQEIGGQVTGSYVVICSGGMSLGGKRTGPVMAYVPVVAGGMADGGKPAYGANFAPEIAGGMADGGEAAYSSGILVGGGIAIGGEITAPAMAFVPHATGGMTDGGLAPNLGVFGIFPAGGMLYGGRVHTYAPPVYRVYVNDGAGGPIDYSSSVAEVSTLAYTTGTLSGPATWSYGVRVYDANVDIEELNIDAVVTVILDAAGHDITNIPAPPLTLTGYAGASGSAVLSWHYQRSVNPMQWPTEFRVYRGVGSVSYSSPVATVPYHGLEITTTTITGLTGGTAYLFGVRAANATGEEPNTTTISVVAETAGPTPVINLSAVATTV